MFKEIEHHPCSAALEPDCFPGSSWWRSLTSLRLRYPGSFEPNAVTAFAEPQWGTTYLLNTPLSMAAGAAISFEPSYSLPGEGIPGRCE